MNDTNAPEHPGTIHCIDGETQNVIDTIDTKAAPSPHHFVINAAGEAVPVVKMVAFMEEHRSTIHQYGPKGQLLRTRVGPRVTQVDTET